MLLKIIAAVALCAMSAWAQTAPNTMADQQPPMKWELSDDRRDVIVTFPQEPTASLDAGEVDRLLNGLGEIRAAMWPPYPNDYPPAQTVNALLNPSWVVEGIQDSEDVLVNIRDPRFGWLHYRISREVADQLAAGISQRGKLKPVPRRR
ncbi:MAG TPA: hypothetical protein VFR68_09055 [Candidatus Dormibacteraeota bacterium]|nr:hypothetical protein [Candidatus Dormibacteraeota bacterium]